MKIKASLLAGLIASAPFVLAQDVEIATDPVGYVSVDLAAASDTRISVPMHRTPAFQGIPESVDGTSIHFAEGTGIQPENLDYFVAVRNGDLAGLRATVVSVENDGDTLVLEDGVDLSGLSTGEGGDSVQLIPHTTLGWLFRELEVTDGSQVLVFDRSEPGINNAASQVFDFNASTGQWEDIFGTSQDDTVIHQTDSIIVREGGGDDLTLVIDGSVPMFPHQDILSTATADAPQDLAIGFSVPAVVTLGESGLGQNGDQLLVPANDETGINKAAAQVIEYSDGWQDIFGTDMSGFELEPGVGYTYRKAGTAEPQTFVHTPSYLD